MADFDTQLNQILSNPEAMAQIAQLAQSLAGPSAPTSTASSAPTATAPSAPTQIPSDEPPPDIPSIDSPFQITPPPPPQVPPTTPPSTVPPQVSPSTVPPPPADTLKQFLPLLRELGGQRDSQARKLLYALRPYLSPHRQNKMERALQLARLWCVGKNFLSEWEG